MSIFRELNKLKFYLIDHLKLEILLTLFFYFAFLYVYRIFIFDNKLLPVLCVFIMLFLLFNIFLFVDFFLFMFNLNKTIFVNQLNEEKKRRKNKKLKKK